MCVCEYYILRKGGNIEAIEVRGFEGKRCPLVYYTPTRSEGVRESLI
jgi:hypothetical protein